MKEREAHHLYYANADTLNAIKPPQSSRTAICHDRRYNAVLNDQEFKETASTTPEPNAVEGKWPVFKDPLRQSIWTQ